MTGSGDPVGGEVLPPEEARVRELLRAAAGTVGPLPADVAARVDAALARARAEDSEHSEHSEHSGDAGDAERGAPASTGAGARVASLAEHRRTRPARWRSALVAVAAAGVVAAGAGALVDDGVLGGGAADSGSTAGGAGDSAAEAAGAAGLAAPVLRSGTDYADTAAVAAAGALLLQAPATTGDPDGGGGTGGGRPAPDALPGVDAERDLKSSAVPSAEVSAGTPDESQRPTAERALACARAAGVDAASVAAVQIAAWRSQPAALVVQAPADGAAGEVVVVALGCTPGDEPLDRVELPASPVPGTP
ncbi:hypothetical protein [Kineococcus esterisolvens]|uniref:hypothetical protein n=1 Tax=unclassified Kineococcus TaxID=2621656 RepID=UPI003D7D0A12